MLLAITIGLTVADLDNLTVGMLNDLAIAMNDGEDGEAREATQADYSAF